jgi:hypothetical protein
MAWSSWDRFLIWLGGNNPEVKKKRLLKRIRKDLRSSAYHHFFKLKTREIQPALAIYLYDIYKTISAAQIFMQRALGSERLRQITLETFLDLDDSKIATALAGETMEARMKKTDPQILARQLRGELAALTKAFDPALIKEADQCYSLIAAFIQFISFDYFAVLKRFDPTMRENSFAKPPRFKAVKAELVLDHIKDFLETSFPLDPEQNWRAALEVMKTYKNGMDVVGMDPWRKLLTQLWDIRNAQILELIIRYVEEKPDWSSSYKIPRLQIAQAWLAKKRLDIEEAIDRTINAKRDARISELAQAVFGEEKVSRLKNYTEEAGVVYVRRNFEGFLHARALNYQKAFLQDHFNGNIQPLCDMLLIRGQWFSPALSQPLSDAFHALQILADELNVFDEVLGDSGERGMRLRVALANAGSQRQARQLRSLLGKINEEAADILFRNAQSLAGVETSLSAALEDHRKEAPELLMNWRELEVAAPEQPLAGWITGIIEKISAFVQILRVSTQTGEEVS